MGQTRAHLDFQAEKKKNKGQSTTVILLAPPVCSTWCRMVQGKCCSSDTKCLLLHVELASDFSVVLAQNCGSPLLSPYKDIPATNLQWASPVKLTDHLVLIYSNLLNREVFLKGLGGGYPELHSFSLEHLWPPPSTSTP